MAAVNYPPEGLYKDFKIGKRNFEHIILWMLANNENCQWPLNFAVNYCEDSRWDF